MAFTGNFLCTSFKVELLKGVHNFTATTGNTFNIALYEIVLRSQQRQQRILRAMK